MPEGARTCSLAHRPRLQYYSEAHALVFVVDASDPGRLKEAEQAFEAVVAHEALETVPVLVLANKEDVAVRRRSAVAAAPPAALTPARAGGARRSAN